jgi:hypothetical protein
MAKARRWQQDDEQITIYSFPLWHLLELGLSRLALWQEMQAAKLRRRMKY